VPSTLFRQQVAQLAFLAALGVERLGGNSLESTIFLRHVKQQTIRRVPNSEGEAVWIIFDGSKWIKWLGRSIPHFQTDPHFPVGI
jgi:hypothetical protein